MKKRIENIYLIIGLIPILWLFLIFGNYFLVTIGAGESPEYLSGMNAEIYTYPFAPDGVIMTAVMFLIYFGVVGLPILIMTHMILAYKTKLLKVGSIKFAILSYSGYAICFSFVALHIDPVKEMLMYFID